MFELCALLAAKKVKKARKASGPKIAAGANVTVMGNAGVVIGRDAKYANAWIVQGANGKQMSFSRDMIAIVA